MKKLKVLKDFNYNVINSYKHFNPYCIAFVYTKNISFIVKGGCIDVEKYLKEYKVPMLVNKTFWKNGKSRNIWSLENCGDFYLSNDINLNIEKHGRPYIIYRVIKNSKILREKVVFKKLRKIPNKWIKDLDNYI